jgi:hypothetical protein
MFLSESAAYPAVATIAQSAYDQMVREQVIDYRVLNELIGEASAKGVLRAIRRKYSPTAYEAIIDPILQEIGRRAPIRSNWRSSMPHGSEDDPLTAPTWPPR